MDSDSGAEFSDPSSHIIVKVLSTFNPKMKFKVYAHTTIRKTIDAFFARTSRSRIGSTTMVLEKEQSISINEAEYWDTLFPNADRVTIFVVPAAQP